MKFKLWFKILLFLIFLTLISFFVWQKFFTEKRELNIQYPIPLELMIDGFRYQTMTRATNVRDFLEEKGIIIYSKDLVNPVMEGVITAHSIISITSNKKLSIKVDGETREVDTIRRTIEKLLKDEGIKLNPFDKISSKLELLAKDEDEITITRIEKKNVIEKQEVEYETIVKTDKKIEWKKQKIKQEGENGLREVEYEIVYKNGELVSKTKLATKIIEETQSEIILEGRKIEVVSKQKGMATWYAFKGGMYCASVRYPRGTWLRVTSKDNDKQIIVQVNDYGPDPGTGKVIDLDKVAFSKLMSVGAGVISVKIEEIKSD